VPEVNGGRRLQSADVPEVDVPEAPAVSSAPTVVFTIALDAEPFRTDLWFVAKTVTDTVQSSKKMTFVKCGLESFQVVGETNFAIDMYDYTEDFGHKMIPFRAL
jgi:hypothetical protein